MKLIINGKEKTFKDGLMLDGLMEDLKIDSDKTAVEVNARIISQDRWAGTKLSDGDKLEIITFVGGG